MEKKTSSSLEKIFPLIKNRARMVVVFGILFVLTIMFSSYIKAGLFILLFIALSGVSKFYHKFFKSTIGVDLVFFTTMMIALAYNNILLTLIIAWPGLIIADSLGTKFSHTSVVSLIGLTIIALVAKLLMSTLLPFIISAIILMVIYETITCVAYYFLGSSFDKIAVFLVSHLMFNLFLIFSFAQSLKGFMI
jgi:hypothetical protein